MAPRPSQKSQTLEELLGRMWRIRAFEIRAMDLFEENQIRGSVHPYIGMEAIAVGVCAALAPTTTSPAPTAVTATASRRAST